MGPSLTPPSDRVVTSWGFPLFPAQNARKIRPLYTFPKCGCPEPTPPGHFFEESLWQQKSLNTFASLVSCVSPFIPLPVSQSHFQSHQIFGFVVCQRISREHGTGGGPPARVPLPRPLSLPSPSPATPPPRRWRRPTAGCSSTRRRSPAVPGLGGRSPSPPRGVRLSRRFLSLSPCAFGDGEMWVAPSGHPLPGG